MCLHDDLARARELYPDAPLIAVNGAAREVKAIALYSRHPQHFTKPSYNWIKRQRRFGDDFTVHASNTGGQYLNGVEGVEFWWEDARGGGGSAWGARKLAWLMGFEPVILCGCPLVPGPYVGNHSLGGLMYNNNVVEEMRRGLEQETEWHDGAYSMSGWTRELLGDQDDG